MSDFTIDGADQFLRLSKALKAAGRTDMRKELNKAVKAAAKPVIKDIREAARSDLPKSGGLNEVVAKSPTVIRTRTGKDPGVSVAMPKRQAGYLDGNIRHPVFAKKTREQGSSSKRKDGTVARYKRKSGKAAKWVNQKVDGDWFDGTVEHAAPTVRPHIEKALEAIADQIVREAKP